MGNDNEVDTQVQVPFMKQWRESWEELGGETPQLMAGTKAFFAQVTREHPDFLLSNNTQVFSGDISHNQDKYKYALNF